MSYREIDWDVLVKKVAGPEPDTVIYRFSNGRRFTQRADENPYKNEDEDEEEAE